MHSCLENPINCIGKQKDTTKKDELHRSVGTQYAAEEEHRINSRKKEEAESKRKQCPDVGVSGGESKVQYCKKQLWIVTWNVKSINQGILELTISMANRWGIMKQ